MTKKTNESNFLFSADGQLCRYSHTDSQVFRYSHLCLPDTRGTAGGACSLANNLPITSRQPMRVQCSRSGSSVTFSFTTDKISGDAQLKASSQDFVNQQVAAAAMFDTARS